MFNLRFKIDPFLDSCFYQDFDDSPMVVFDAGAAGEVFSLFPHGNKKAIYHCFEPNPESNKKLLEKYKSVLNLNIHNIALSDTTGNSKFRVFNATPFNSSLYANDIILGESMDQFSEINIKTKTLDSFCSDSDMPDFIKLDTEGSEHLVLQGGAKVIESNVLGIVTEVKFMPLSDNMSRFNEINSILDKHDFILTDMQLSRINRSGRNGIGGKKGAIDTAYVLYFRDFFKYYKSLGDRDDAYMRDRLLKMLSIVSNYLYFDYAIELVEFGKDQNLLTTDEANTLYNVFCTRSDMAWHVPDFPGKSKLSLFFDALSYILSPELKLAVPPFHNSLGNRRSFLIKKKRDDKVNLYYPVRSNTDRSYLKHTIKTK
jgi:FkbM family methyltransferase